MNFNIEIIEKFWQYILSGIPVILLISLVAAFFGTVIGLVSVLLRRWTKVTKWITEAYIDIFRGTPVYVQLYFFYFGIPSLFKGLVIGKIFSCILIFSLNSGAYLAEIMRAGVDGIDKGQIEAARALGVGNKDIAKDIIIPQAFRKVLPAVINEFITLTKETSVVSIVGVADMMYKFQTVKNSIYNTFEPLLIVFVAYYVMNKILSFIGKAIEKRLKYD
ncbi:His/Glu/Gln/Arg/opine family amino acid ABC transporter permease subunit [Breznakia sp. PF5-3]|uniref:amino acid ABC transporter permease n=1 Tax=unclassified Breznakia TaxID=2623764 RepID=UPI00240771DA|nr:MULTISPECIES: amino acid ABC transporter permease [unclassified Breznakia]MDF9825782.1 His/Glu/Gln/Arg/opine family amino acid ABC transporter permease subunit [Breznakia sp. PM6-1]MDF9836587.1 His/Glu/Gln/Arg/opine family amino acid ABC transporter permease subunit [Breznakia sp. PF5-3]MDF9838815.1 His/Glu/Gln/Arg/opine family amino acid ABC transporter permease subunit [Breznakia sp. PFB2-8]MDF9860841.1 His/Glu/Gln/Arg/opine family amino acid ABC transporter permease subunit [Breznakia sp.